MGKGERNREAGREKKRQSERKRAGGGKNGRKKSREFEGRGRTQEEGAGKGAIAGGRSCDRQWRRKGARKKPRAREIDPGEGRTGGRGKRGDWREKKVCARAKRNARGKKVCRPRVVQRQGRREAARGGGERARDEVEARKFRTRIEVGPKGAGGGGEGSAQGPGGRQGGEGVDMRSTQTETQGTSKGGVAKKKRRKTH